MRNIDMLGYPEKACLLYTSDAADERSSVDLGGRRIIKKKHKTKKKNKKYKKKNNTERIRWEERGGDVE